jgi:uncharacterized Zn-binding protein involved in type VI secretion
MGQPAAKQGDQVMGTCIHNVLVPSPTGPVPTPLPHPFVGILDSGLSTNVMISKMAAATLGSQASNTPSHIPTPPGTSFVVPPMNKATINKGSATVMINKKPAARMGDTAMTCSEVPMPANVIAVGNVMIGG